ncbi:MAG: DUF3576 domain-containing protein [Pseudomonadota bacterium]
MNKLIVGPLAALILAGCGGVNVEEQYPEQIPGTTSRSDPFYRDSKYAGDNLFTDDGYFDPLGPGRSGGGTSGIGVNTYLWKASLDTVSFMPLASADPFGGVILTDWYVSQEAPSERVKVAVRITDTALTANGLKVNVYRQQRTEAGWVDAGVRNDTAIKIENAILTRAKQLKIAQAGR